LHDIRGMAIEALTHFGGSSQTAGGFHQVVRHDRLRAHGQIEAPQRGIVTDATLIPAAFTREEVRLSRRALPEGPVDGDPQGLLAIRYRVDGLVADPRNLVGVSPD